jgi:hypothetical protein
VELDQGTPQCDLQFEVPKIIPDRLGGIHCQIKHLISTAQVPARA